MNNWKHYLLELIIVISGVTVAFWLSNISESKKENKLERIVLNDLRADLLKDSASLVRCINFNKTKVETLKSYINLINSDSDKSQIDSAMQIIGVIGNYDFFFSKSFTLSSLLQSGDIKLIRSRSIKKDLLELRQTYDQVEWLQNNFLQALDQNFFPTMYDKIDMINNKALDPEFIYSVQILNFALFAANDTNQAVANYEYTLRLVNNLLEQLPAEE